VDRQDGSLVLERADNIVPLATKTANLVPQVVVHLQVLLPAEAQSFGISQVVLDKLVSTFNAFIDHKPKAHTPAQAQAPAVTIVEFLAHLHAVMQALLMTVRIGSCSVFMPGRRLLELEK
jgi:hypothetical protein